jgi:hypothetical protein
MLGSSWDTSKPFQTSCCNRDESIVVATDAETYGANADGVFAKKCLSLTRLISSLRYLPDTSNILAMSFHERATARNSHRHCLLIFMKLEDALGFWGVSIRPLITKDHLRHSVPSSGTVLQLIHDSVLTAALPYA